MQEEKNVFDVLQELIAKFDFEKVRAYMLLTKWEWDGQGVPTVEDLKSVANMCLNKAAFDSPAAESYCGGTGGFYAYKFIWSGKEYYKLTFEPFTTSNY